MALFDNFDFMGALAQALGNSDSASAPAGGGGPAMPSQPPAQQSQPPQQVSTSSDSSVGADAYPLDVPAGQMSMDQGAGPGSQTDPYPLNPTPGAQPSPQPPQQLPPPQYGPPQQVGPPMSLMGQPQQWPPATPTGVSGVAPGGAPPAASVRPPMAAPMPPGGQNIAAPSIAGGFLSGIFGRDPRVLQQNVHSIASGLSAVGQNWNKPAAAAFAASLGAAMRGGQLGDREYYGELADSLTRYSKDQNEKTKLALQQARDEARAKVGTNGQRQSAWMNSEVGRFDAAMRRLSVDVDNKRKELQHSINEVDPEKSGAARKELNEYREARQRQLLQHYGLDPNKYEHYQNSGQPVYGEGGKIDRDKTMEQAHRPKNAIDFNATVKPGDYFINPANGRLYQRTSDVPPPADSPSSPIAHVGNALGPDEDQEAEAA